MSGQRDHIQSHPFRASLGCGAHRIAAKRSVVHRPSALLRHGHEVRCQRWLLVLWPQCAAASATCGSSRAGAILWTAATMDGLPRRQWSFTPHQSSQLTTEGRTRKSERDTRRAVTTASHVLSSSGHAEALCALQVFWRETTHTSHASTLTQLVACCVPVPAPRTLNSHAISVQHWPVHGHKIDPRDIIAYPRSLTPTCANPRLRGSAARPRGSSRYGSARRQVGRPSRTI